MTGKIKVQRIIYGYYRRWRRQHVFGDVEINPCAFYFDGRDYWTAVSEEHEGACFAIGRQGQPAMYFRLLRDDQKTRTRLDAFGINIERKRGKTYAFGVEIREGVWYRTGDFVLLDGHTWPTGFRLLNGTVCCGETPNVFLVPDGSPDASLTGGKKLAKCRICHWWHLETDMENGYCRECATSHTCQECHRVDDVYQAVRADGEHVQLCMNCILHLCENRSCEGCGQSVLLNSGLRGTRHGEHVVLCSICAQNFTRCPDCGELLTQWETCRCKDPITIDGYHDGRRKNAYSHILSILGEDMAVTPTLGVELEMGRGDVRKIHEGDTALALYKGGVIHFEHDSSLNGVGGIEMITVPCTFRHHAQIFGWPVLCHDLIGAGWRSHDKCQGCCGFHIHIGRAVFNRGGMEAESRYNNLDAFVNKAWKYFSRIGRRNYTEDENNSCIGAGHYAGFKPGVSGKDRNEYDRYRAVNFTNDNTVELRFPKGTLNPETILGTLAIADFLPFFVDEFTEEAITADPLGVAKVFHETLMNDPVRGPYYRPMAERLLPPSIFESADFQGEE